jgi:hypothetical protein
VSVAKGGATPESVKLDPRSGDARDEDDDERAAAQPDPDAVDIAPEAEAPATEPPPIEPAGLVPGATVILPEDPATTEAPVEAPPAGPPAAQPVDAGAPTPATGDEVAPPEGPEAGAEPPR